MSEPAIGVTEFYRRLFAGVLSGARGDEHVQLTVFGAPAGIALDEFAAEHGLVVVRERIPATDKHQAFEVARVLIRPTGTVITVHLT